MPNPSNPDSGEYPPDTGCWAAAHCLECPLVRCVLDEPAPTRLRHQANRIKAIELRLRGMAHAAIASELNVCQRTVYRLLRETPPAAMRNAA